ncbi:MAG: hypothetical protein QM817_10305 [Archangium sp.]
MHFDKQAMFSTNQALTTGTQRSTDVIDLWGGNAGGTDANGNTLLRDLMRSPAVDVGIQVTEDFTAGTNETFNLITGLDGDPTVGSPTVIATSGAVVEAALKKGKQVLIAIPPLPATARYLALQGVASGTHSTGKIMAGLIATTGRASPPGAIS